MPLLARNLTGSDLALAAGSAPTIPSSLVPGLRGVPVDVTSELRPDLTIDPSLGKSGGLDDADYTLLEAQVVSGDVSYEWTGIPEYNVGSLLVQPPIQTTKFIVGKDPGDQFSSVKSALDAAGTVATATVPVIVLIKPGNYTESDLMSFPNNVWLQSTVDSSPQWPGYNWVCPTVSITGKISVTHTGKCGLNNIGLYAVDTDPILTISSSGKIVFSNCYIAAKSSSTTTLINQTLGTISAINCSIGGDGTMVTLLQTGGSFYSYGSEIGASNAGVIRIDSTNAIFTTTNSTIWGPISLKGTGTSIHKKSIFQFNSATLGFNAEVGRDVRLFDCAFEQSNSSGPKLLGACAFKIYGIVSTSSNENTPVLFKPTSASVLYPTFIDKVNCDYRTYIHTTNTTLNISTQQRVVITNQSTDVASTLNLPASPLTGEEHVIIDGKGDGAVRNVTINGNGKNINGSASVIVAVNYGRLHVVYNGTQWNVISQTLA